MKYKINLDMLKYFWVISNLHSNDLINIIVNVNLNHSDKLSLIIKIYFKKIKNNNNN